MRMLGPVIGAVLCCVVSSAVLAAASSARAEPTPAPPIAVEQRININTAGPAELDRLPGIGPTRAQAIVDVRQKRPFRRVEDIMRVPGIGRKTFSRIRSAIYVE